MKILKDIFCKKKRVLIVSSNFSGGGLETRINNIVNHFHSRYCFSLITTTSLDNMKIKPSLYFEKIYGWEEYNEALKNIDIIDIHPFNVCNLLKEWNVSDDVKKIYTLHGEASIILEDLSFLEKYDHIYSVSKFLIPKVTYQYPKLKNKISLSKNYDIIEEHKSYNKISNDILFLITNIRDQEYVQNIIEHIPMKYTVHIVGSFKEGMLNRNQGKIVFHGFISIDKLFNQYNFFIGFARGGFATIDIVKRNIPCFCISSNDQGVYLELLSKDNFLILSDSNFVTRKHYDAINISNGIDLIERCCKKYQCYSLLKKYNTINKMQDIYKIFYVSKFTYYRYKFLSKILWGKKRKKYKQKYKRLKSFANFRGQ